jgi:hypothetical protein
MEGIGCSHDHCTFSVVHNMEKQYLKVQKLTFNEILLYCSLNQYFYGLVHSIVFQLSITCENTDFSAAAFNSMVP